MSKKNFFSNIFNQISELFRDKTKYSLSRMSPIHITSKNNKLTNCWFSLSHYPKPKLRNLLQNAFYFIISMNSNTIFLMK